MNVYDFDNTIYDGESTLEFFLYFLMQNKKYISYLFPIIYSTILYKLNILSFDDVLKQEEKITKLIVSNKDQIDNLVENFWKQNKYKLKKSFLDKLTNEDLIITASPQFILKPLEKELNVKEIITSKLSLETGKIEFMCYKDNKLKIFKELYPNEKIDNFYTDSLNDKSLISISDNSYLVKGNKIKKLEL